VSTSTFAGTTHQLTILPLVPLVSLYPSCLALPNLFSLTHPSLPGWNKEEALQSAIEKAGYRPNVRLSDLKDLVVQKYRSEKVGVRYDEWKESRGM
jgi:AMMECR1 domain-containing protein